MTLNVLCNSNHCMILQEGIANGVLQWKSGKHDNVSFSAICNLEIWKKKMIKETKHNHETSKTNTEAKKYYTKIIQMLTFHQKLIQIANSSVNHNAAWQNSIGIFLCLEQSEVKYSAVNDKKMLYIPLLNMIMVNGNS